MVDAEIIKEWISKADEDFEFALSNLNEGKRFFSQICFHFQQASEKYLKSFIIAKELEFRKIHDLPLLLKICSARGPYTLPTGPRIFLCMRPKKLTILLHEYVPSSKKS